MKIQFKLKVNIPVEKWLTSISFAPHFIVQMKVVSIPVPRINLIIKVSCCQSSCYTKKSINLNINNKQKEEKSNYSFNPMLKGQFLSFVDYGQTLPHLTTRLQKPLDQLDYFSYNNIFFVNFHLDIYIYINIFLQ